MDKTPTKTDPKQLASQQLLLLHYGNPHTWNNKWSLNCSNMNVINRVFICICYLHPNHNKKHMPYLHRVYVGDSQWKELTT